MSGKLTGLRLAAAVVLAAPLLRAAEPAVTDITSDDFSSSAAGDETTSVFTGHVSVTSGDLRISCDDLKAISVAAKAAPPAAGQQFRYLLATGHVRIVQGSEEAACDRAEVLPIEGKMTLTGSPVLIDHDKGTTVTGEKIVRWRDGRTTISHPVIRARQKDFDLGLRPPQAAPAPKP